MPAADWIRAGLPGSTEPMSGLGDLALYLGGSEDSFTGRLLELVAKAQATPEHMAGLRRGFPNVVHAWQTWMAMSPSPTADELHAVLASLAAGEMRTALDQGASLRQVFADLAGADPVGDVPDAAVHAVLDVMGWPDDRTTGLAIDGTQTYWELAVDVARAARAEFAAHLPTTPVETPALAGAGWEWGAACDVRCDRNDWSYTWGFDDRVEAEEYVGDDPVNRRLVRRRPELIEEVGDAG